MVFAEEQSVPIGKPAAYFRGKTRQNPEEILGLPVLAVGHELVCSAPSWRWGKRFVDLL